MASVKLVNNPNRSMNPFKGQFLLNFKVKLRNDNTKGKVVSEGNYVFKHYQELIELEDYLIEYLNERVDQKSTDKSILKWPLDAELQKAFLYYKSFFLKKEDDDKLEDLWLDLKVAINKVDDFIEKETNEIWKEYLEQGDAKTLYKKAYALIKQLISQVYFKTSVKLLSDWIKLICDAKGVEYEVTQKISPTGVKFNIFVEKEKPKEVLEAQAENIQEIKKKYIQYEKAKLKSKLSSVGAYTSVKLEEGDTLDLYYGNPPLTFDKEKFIKERKEKYLESANTNLDTKGKQAILKCKDANDLEKFRQESIFEELLLPRKQMRYLMLGNSLPNGSKMVKYHQHLLKNNVKPNLAFVIEQFLGENNLVPVGLSFKPLITKIKQSKIETDEKLALIVSQYLISLGLDLDTEPAKNILEQLSNFKMSTYLTIANEIQTDIDQTSNTKEYFEQTYLPIIKEFANLEKPNYVYDNTSINLEVEKLNKENNKKITALYSDALGVIEGENGKSAYEIYQEKKAELDQKVRGLKSAFPTIEGNVLTFRNLKRTPVYQKDAEGNVIYRDGRPLPEYEKGRGGVLKEDDLGNPIPKYENQVIDEIHIDRMTDEQIASLSGLEVEVELSDDTSIKASSPFKFAHIVKVKNTVVNGIAKQIITKGPYKGFSVEDLANATGKFLGDGQSYSVDTNGRIVSIHETVTNDEGEVSINISALKEPYITWANGRFMIGLPADHAHQGERESLRDLQKTRASIEVVPGSIRRRFSFYFEGDDYEAIKDCLGSCLMSKKAQVELKNYYTRILEKDRALKEENVAKYTATAIGGFKDNVKLNNKQKEALAWLDSNGMKGVMSLDTGVGKTLTGVSAMQIATKNKPNAKFLIVGPDRLNGNFIGEIKKFLKEDVANDLIGRTKEIGYTEFVKMYQENFNFKSAYYCMIFDEVNEALTGKKAQAISGVKHPNKILLTASSLEKSPVDLFRFVSLSTGNPVDPEKETAFAEKFAVNIGGKFVGIKPEAKHQFNVWLKQNAYFANKMDVDYEEVGQVPLKPLNQASVAVNMDRDVEKAYLSISKDIQKELKEMQDRYAYLLSSGDVSAMPEELQKEKDIAVGNLKNKIALLHLFSLNPNKAMAKVKGGKASDYNYPNPKISEATRLATEFTEGAKKRRAIYFTEDNDVAKETVIALSKKIRGKVHALCLTSYIQFYRDGKPLVKSKVTKKTNVENFVLRTATDANTPVDMSWAIKTVKKFIADNEQVVSMVANSSYSRGFNLQKFKAVVHLDRDGWDSEEIKQRTARAFRQGQEDEVLEVMVDAVLSPATEGTAEMSIDQLRGMAHGADQKFFNSIIKESGAIKLSENYDKVEHAVVSEKATQPSLQNFTRAIAPTREILNEAEEMERGKKENPIKYTTLDPNRFNHPSLANLTEKEKKMADLSGLSGIANVASDQIKLSVTTGETYTTTDAVSNWLNYFNRYDRGDHIYNSHFNAKTCAPNSIGNRALFSQLVAMKREGKAYLKTNGVGNFSSFDEETGLGKPGEYIGFYIWPKFGYNAKVSIEKRDKKLKDYADMYQQVLRVKTPGIDRLNTQPPVKPVKQDLGASRPLTLRSFGEEFEFTSQEEQKKKLLSLMNPNGRSNETLFKTKLKGVNSSLDLAGFLAHGYFKKREVEEEKNWYKTNRIVFGYGKKVETYPFSKVNTIDPNTIVEGQGKYYSTRSDDFISNSVNTSFTAGRETSVRFWNLFVDEYVTNYKGLTTLYNRIIDENIFLTNEDLLAALPMINQNVATPERIQEVENQYRNDMLIYNQQYQQYEENLKIVEQAVADANIVIEKRSIIDDINNNVYPYDVKTFLSNGRQWWKLRYAKSAFIILKKLGSVPSSIDILDLYAITAKESDGTSFKAGELWWSYVGDSTEYKLTLDNDNSKSYKHLTKYMMSKVNEAGFETLEEYLSSPVEPFNVDTYDCWISFFAGSYGFSNTENIEILKSYMKNLKKVLLTVASHDRATLLDSIKRFEENNKVKFNVSRVAKARKKAEENYISSEQLMAQNAQQDGDLFTAIQDQLENEEIMQNTQKEIAVLRGDLKPVSNPFGNSKKGTM